MLINTHLHAIKIIRPREKNQVLIRQFLLFNSHWKCGSFSFDMQSTTLINW